MDLAYCHHILAINSLNIANIVLDPTYIKPVEPRRLAVRNTKRARPKNLGKALEPYIFFFFCIYFLNNTINMDLFFYFNKAC